MKEIQTGRDLSQSARAITIEGVRYTLKFNNRAARIAEDIYADEYGRDIGYYAILEEAAKHRHGALMAIYYGALVAGGQDMSWEFFDDAFTLNSIEGISDIIQQGIAESLPAPTEKN